MEISLIQLIFISKMIGMVVLARGILGMEHVNHGRSSSLESFRHIWSKVSFLFEGLEV